MNSSMVRTKRSLLVTGGLGFIGLSLVRKLHQDFDIVVLSKPSVLGCGLAATPLYHQESGRWAVPVSCETGHKPHDYDHTDWLC